MTLEYLEKMKSVDLQAVEAQDLSDIRDISVNPELPPETKLEEYLEQAKNPYCFVCGNSIIKISFDDDSPQSLDDQFGCFLRSQL